MSFKNTIKTDLVDALKKKEQEKVSTLRMVNAAIKNQEIELKKRDEGLNDEELIEVLTKEAKKRRDAIEAYEKGGRDDLVQKETAELKLIETYLPKQLTDDEIRSEVKRTIEKMGTTDAKNFGKVMGMVMTRLKGKAEGTRVSAIVREVLSSK